MKIKSLTLAAAALRPSRFPRAPRAEIAVSGRSNVGKSSLLNTLCGRRDFARTSKSPGKTRTVNFYLVNDRFYLVDLPGYGYAKVSRSERGGWARLIETYLESRENLGGVIQLIDPRHGPSAKDVEMLQRLVDAGREFIVVFTKADKVTRSQRARVLDGFGELFDGLTVGPFRSRAGSGGAGAPAERVDVPFLFFSSRTKEGREPLWRWIAERLEGSEA